MRLVSWNIMAGGGGRCAALVDTLLHYDADLLVLQETLPARGPDLCHALRRAGYRYGAREFDRAEEVGELERELPTLEATVVLPYLRANFEKARFPGAIGDDEVDVGFPRRPDHAVVERDAAARQCDARAAYDADERTAFVSHPPCLPLRPAPSRGVTVEVCWSAFKSAEAIMKNCHFRLDRLGFGIDAQERASAASASSVPIVTFPPANGIITFRGVGFFLNEPARGAR